MRQKAFRLTYYLTKEDIIRIIENLLEIDEKKYFNRGEVIIDNEVQYQYKLIWNKKLPTKKECRKHIDFVLYSNLIDDLYTEDKDVNSLAIYIVDKLEIFK